jgi:hypothetical protein
VPKATELESVPVKVSVLLTVAVLPSAIVSVDPVAGAVMATLLRLVAVATPSVGVTSVGLVAKTSDPDPVSSVTAAARFADEGVCIHVTTPLPSDVTPVPPEATGKALPSVREVRCVTASTTLVPSL